MLYSGFNILPRSVIRRQTGFARSDNTDVVLPEPTEPMPSKNQKQICEQLEGCLHYRLNDISLLPEAKRRSVEQLGKHAVLDVIEVDLEAGYPFTVETISEFKKLKKLRINGIDPIENGYDAIFGFLELQDLVFERSGLEDLSGFAVLSNLERFSLYDLTRHQSGAEVFGTLPRLTVLHLNESQISETELQGISGSKSILDLSFSVDGKEFDLSPIGKMQQLKYLQILKPNAFELDFSCLLKLPNLKRFKTSHQVDADSVIFEQLEERGTVIDA